MHRQTTEKIAEFLKTHASVWDVSVRSDCTDGHSMNNDEISADYWGTIPTDYGGG